MVHNLSTFIIIESHLLEGCFDCVNAEGGGAAQDIRPLCLSLSGNQLEDEGCQLMAEAAPQLRIARKLE